MNRIRVLPGSLANQIAAGEVIERPASVIKELLENSIDAGATEIYIEAGKGGTELIRVRDNGQGIHNDDLELALQSHATSKIQNQADLEHITSLGFRGEALPSIASVSQFLMISRVHDSDHAWQIRKDAVTGLSEVLPASHPAGTTVEVRNLFHSTPARRKFLRSERTEYLHILEMVRRIALSRPGITMRMVHNGKQVFHCGTGAGGRRLLMETVMGRSFTGNARAFDFSTDNMHLHGWAVPSTMSRSQSDRQYFYLNGRVIRDRQINHAVRLAYEDTLPAGRHPVYVIYLDMDPGTTDVNVHPTKHEVRFKNARDVHDFLLASLKQIVVEDDLNGNRNQAREPLPFYARLTGAESVSDEDQPALGQPKVNIYGRFIVSKRRENYLLIDIHRARRHVIKTRMHRIGAGRPLHSRPLLVPVSVDISRHGADLIQAHHDKAEVYGLTLDRIGPESIVIRSIPVILPEVDLEKLAHEISELFDKDPDTNTIHNNMVSIFENHACEGLTEEMSMDDMIRLLRSLEESGIDTGAADYPGIWRTLSIDMLKEYLS